MAIERLKIGEKDKFGREVEFIYSSTDSFLIYKSLGGLTFTIDPKLRSSFQQMEPIFSKIQSLQTGSLQKDDWINKPVARGFTRAFSGQLEEAKTILLEVLRKIENTRVIRGRGSYLGSCGAAMGSWLLFLALVLWLDSAFFQNNLGESLVFFKIAACGAMGGFFSVALGIRKVEIDMDEDRTTLAISGFSRISVAIIGSLFVYFAITSGLILGNLADMKPVGFYTFSFLAGFSETLVPNILRKISEDNKLTGRKN